MANVLQISALHLDDSTYQLKDNTSRLLLDQLSGEISAKIIVDADGEQYSELSVHKVTLNEYISLIASGTVIPSNAMYVIDSDYIECFGQNIKNLADPVESQDAVTKHYVDALAWGGESSIPTWGAINGALSNQIDLKNALDLKANKSQVPTVNNPSITISKNGTAIGSFSLNQASAKTINIEVPAPGTGVLTIQKNGAQVATFNANATGNTTANITTNFSDLQGQATDSTAIVDYVNSSINSYAAFYITKNAAGDPFSTYTELTSTTTVYYAGSLAHGDGIPRRNDYCIVLEDETQISQSKIGIAPTTRYTWQQTDGGDGHWEFQYVVNNTSLTNAQTNAINSGITAALVAQITANQADCTAIHAMIDGVEEQINAL